MSISNNLTIDDKMIHRLVIQAFQPSPDSDNELLKKCSLTEDQKSAIQTILATASNPGQTPANMEKQIASALAGRVTPQRGLQENESTVGIGDLPPEAEQTTVSNPPLKITSDAAPISSLGQLEIIPEDILKFSLSFCVRNEAFFTLSRTCKRLKMMVTEVCIQQLGWKESLTQKEIYRYEKRLGSWDSVFAHCKQLKALDFSRDLSDCYEVFLQDQHDSLQPEEKIALILTSAIQYCPFLTRLDFNNCNVIGDETLAFVGRQFPNLTHLNLESCEYSNLGIQSLVQGCPNLISINLISLDYRQEMNSTVLLIAENCPKLCELYLDGTVAHITDESITVLAKSCPNLTRLKTYCTDITDVSLQALGEHCKGLTFLNLKLCRDLTKNGITLLSHQLPNLQISREITCRPDPRTHFGAHGDIRDVNSSYTRTHFGAGICISTFDMPEHQIKIWNLDDR